MIYVSRKFISCLIFSLLLTVHLSGVEKTGENPKSSVEKLKKKLESIATRLEDLKYQTTKNELPDSSTIDLAPNIPIAVPVSEIEFPLPADQKEPAMSPIKSSDESAGVGFYILPFFGMQNANDLEWNSIGGVFEIEESIGFTGGMRLGYDWKNFFTDFQVSFFHNDMKSIDVPLVFLGETKGVGFHLCGGGRIHFNDHIAGSLGAGLGGVNQETSFLLSGISVQERDFLFSFQFFTGLELRPVDYLLLGIRYRWMRVEQMVLFSSRNMHVAEFSVGYVF